MSRPHKAAGRRRASAPKKLRSPAPQLPSSPARKERGTKTTSARRRSEPTAPGPGSWVVIYLREPREKAFGRLLRTEPAGVWLRGIELESFEAWAREQAAGVSSSLGPSTAFVPYLRVEKIVEDEPMGPVPSLRERFEAITGRTLEEVLASS